MKEKRIRVTDVTMKCIKSMRFVYKLHSEKKTICKQYSSDGENQ